MKNQFVPYDIALALKKLGFDEPCFTYWVNDGVNITFATTHNRSGWSMIGFENNQMIKKAGLCTAPLYQEAFDWFREKHDLHIVLERITENEFSYFIYDHSLTKTKEYSLLDRDGFVKTYDKAKLACLNRLIELMQS